jgi:DNA replication protein DnaC
MNTPENLQGRGNALRLYGLLAHWSDVAAEQWVAPLLQWEEDERARRSLARRIRDARLGNFKPLCDFDWSWPTRCDRLAVEELMSLGFVRDTANVVSIGPNGVGKSTLVLNLAYPALSHPAVHDRRPDARRAGRTRQRFGSAPTPPPLCVT